MRHDPFRRPRRSRLDFLVPIALATALAAGACGDADATRDPEQSPASAEPDTVVAEPPIVTQPSPRRPPGDTVALTAALDEFSIAVSRETIEPGNISIRLENDGERPHTIEIRGETGMRWVSIPIRPGGSVTMRMLIETGNYTIASTDSSYVERGMRARFRVR